MKMYMLKNSDNFKTDKIIFNLQQGFPEYFDLNDHDDFLNFE